MCLAGCSVNAPTTSSLPPDLPAEPVTEPLPEVPEPTPEELAAMRAAKLACTEISIAAVGDIMLGTDFPDNRLPDDDAELLLADVTPTLSGADVAIGNLEGVLLDGGEPVKQCKNPAACYLFRSPSRYAARLAEAGFDVMSLANNHARDFGEEGRNSSMAALAAAGIRHSGRMGDIAAWSLGEIKLAFIAFAPFTNSWSMLDLDAGAMKVRELSQYHDIVIVSFHGGAEGADATRVPFSTERYFGEDRGDVVQFSRTMIQAGADLVIGHGPHVPRAMEIQQGRLVAYSLGNFATYYGINVSGAKGYAPILLATLDGNGQFKRGKIVSAIQVRPDGPRIDNRKRAYDLIRDLTRQDFQGDAIVFHDAGRFTPAAPSAYDCSD